MSSNEKNTRKEPDRISELPDGVIHCIYAFLGMEQIIETSLLSTRWRYLWQSNPYLNVDFSSWVRIQRQNNRLNVGFEEFSYFVDRVLLLRNDIGIHKFYLNCRWKQMPVKFDTWITSILRRNVQEVHLHHMGIFDSTLKALVCKVKILILEWVHIQQVDPSEELILTSSVMEKLVLKEFRYSCKQITLCAPNLKYLSVLATGISENVHCRVKICSPNLTLLEISDYMWIEYLLESLPALNTAKIELLDCEENEKLASYLKNTLSRLVPAKSLTLSATPFQVFSEVPSEFQTRGITFHNTRYLKLTKWSNIGYICAIVKLLENFPNVETLVVERKGTVNPENRGDWEAQLLLSQCKFCHLKSIEIHDPEGSANELKFLKFLLKSAPNLENVFVSRTKTLAREKKLDNYLKELESILQRV